MQSPHDETFAKVSASLAKLVSGGCSDALLPKVLQLVHLLPVLYAHTWLSMTGSQRLCQLHHTFQLNDYALRIMGTVEPF